MADQIIVRVLAADEYAWIGSSPGARMRRGPASALSRAAAGHEVIAVVPGPHTLLTRARVPSSSEAVIAQALPFTVEDRLIDDPETLAFAYSASDEELTCDIAIVSRSVVDGIVEVIEKCGVRVAAALPEILMLPIADPGWSVLLRDGVAVVRTGARSGFAIDAPALETLLAADPENLPRAVCIYTAPGEGTIPRLAPEIETTHVGISDALAALTPSASRENSLDFLRHRRASKARGPSGYAVCAATLILVALTASAGNALLDLQQIESRIAAERAAQIALFRKAFPEVKREINVLAQVDQMINRLRGETRQDSLFLDALYLAGSEAANDEGAIEFSSFSYRDGIFDVHVRGGSARQVESYRNRLASEYFTADLISVEAASGYVAGHLRIARNGP